MELPPNRGTPWSSAYAWPTQQQQNAASFSFAMTAARNSFATTTAAQAVTNGGGQTPYTAAALTPGLISLRATRLADATRNYWSFCLFHRWRELALGQRMPNNLGVLPVRDADKEGPLGAMLPAITCLLRSRLARIERLRSMRRWHMLYTAHGTMLPCEHSHVACLSKGLRSWDEYNFFVGLAQTMMGQAAAELVRADMAYAIRSWRIAMELDAQVRRRLSMWGPLAIAQRCLIEWARHTEGSIARADEALRRAERWLDREGGAKAPRIALLRRWRAAAEHGNGLLHVIAAVRRLRKARGFEAWREWGTSCLLQYAKDNAAVAHAVRMLCGRLRRGWLDWVEVFDEQRRRLSCKFGMHNTAVAHAVRMLAGQLRRGWWVWLTVCNVKQSLRGLTVCAYARVNAHVAIRRWVLFVSGAPMRRARDRAASAALFLADKRAWLQGNAMRKWQLRSTSDFELRRTVGRAWRRGALKSGMRRWDSYISQLVDHGASAIRLLVHRSSAVAWRTWREVYHARVAYVAAGRRLLETAKSLRSRSVAGSLGAAIRNWRAHVESCSQAARRKRLARRALAHMSNRAFARVFTTWCDELDRRRALHTLGRRAVSAHEIWAFNHAWEVWLGEAGRQGETMRLFRAAVFFSDDRCLRRVARRMLRQWLVVARERRRAASIAGRWRAPAVAFAYARLAELWRLKRIGRHATASIALRRRAVAIRDWSETAEAKAMDHALMALAARAQDRSQLSRALMEWRSAAAWLLRTELLAARHAFQARLDIASSKVHSVMKTTAFRTLAHNARFHLANSKRVRGLGRHLHKIARGNVFQIWTDYVAYE